MGYAEPGESAVQDLSQGEQTPSLQAAYQGRRLQQLTGSRGPSGSGRIRIKLGSDSWSDKCFFF